MLGDSSSFYRSFGRFRARSGDFGLDESRTTRTNLCTVHDFCFGCADGADACRGGYDMALGSKVGWKQGRPHEAHDVQKASRVSCESCASIISCTTTSTAVLDVGRIRILSAMLFGRHVECRRPMQACRLLEHTSAWGMTTYGSCYS